MSTYIDQLNDAITQKREHIRAGERVLLQTKVCLWAAVCLWVLMAAQRV